MNKDTPIRTGVSFYPHTFFQHSGLIAFKCLPVYHVISINMDLI